MLKKYSKYFDNVKEKNGRKFPRWAGIIDPWGSIICYTDSEGNNESMVCAELEPSIMDDRRKHSNFLAEELKVGLYKFNH